MQVRKFATLLGKHMYLTRTYSPNQRKKLIDESKNTLKKLDSIINRKTDNIWSGSYPEGSGSTHKVRTLCKKISDNINETLKLSAVMSDSFLIKNIKFRTKDVFSDEFIMRNVELNQDVVMMKHTGDVDLFRKLTSDIDLEPITKLHAELNYVCNSDHLGPVALSWKYFVEKILGRNEKFPGEMFMILLGYPDNFIRVLSLNFGYTNLNRHYTDLNQKITKYNPDDLCTMIININEDSITKMLDIVNSFNTNLSIDLKSFKDFSILCKNIERYGNDQKNNIFLHDDYDRRNIIKTFDVEFRDMTQSFTNYNHHMMYALFMYNMNCLRMKVSN
jgi:hypothetical protein